MVDFLRVAGVFSRSLALGGALALVIAAPLPLVGQNAPRPTEDDYYPMITFPTPPEVVLEVGGLEWLDDAKTRLVACTRRGEVWLIENPYAKQPQLAPPPAPEGEQATGEEVPAEQIVAYKQMLFGLHEPLGLLRHQGWLYTAQRAELSRMKDTSGDDRIDLVETVNNSWETSGDYHEYAFGPELAKDGLMWITLNRPFGGQPEGTAHWRSWAVTVDPATGEMVPRVTGLRSPAGIGQNLAGDIFFSDNQGEWVPVCKLSHITAGPFHGHPVGLHSTDRPDSPFKLPDGAKSIPSGLPLAEAADRIHGFTLPAIWFPYPHMGKSHSDVLCDTTEGKFGPFAGQMFVGDQANAIVIRCTVEQVNGQYQGACYPFRRGFQCGVLRMTWGHDGSMFCGQTNRGWGSSGGKPHGLQRISWSGKTPFEIYEATAEPDGFTLTFTMPVDPETAGDPASYRSKRWTYYHHSGYGCPPVDEHPVEIRSATVSDDRKSVRLVLDSLKRCYVHELRAEGVRSAADNLPLLHPDAYYTLNHIPAAE